jgi:hypothetical protein
MKTLIAFLVLASVAALAANRPQQTYYISPSGNDGNAGTQASPWLSPNHSLNCGDTIIAAAGTYSHTNFDTGKWGTVTCASGQSVAWLVCETFDSCNISAGANFGIWVDKSYWGVAGWEVTTTSSGWTCFAAAPPSGATATIHHIIFANDIANGCGGGGFGSFSTGNFGADYVEIIGNIAYNASQNHTNCYSGISIFQPVKSDSVAGTHIYVAGNFSWGNINPGDCPNPPTGGVNTATDGEGAIFDTFDWHGVGGSAIYDQAAGMDNNVFLSNGGYGMEYQNYVTNPSAAATVFRRNNTVWGNNTSSARNSTVLCAESMVNVAYNVADTGNIVQATRSLGCATANTIRAASKWDTSNASGSSDSGNWYVAASGSATSSSNGDGNTFSYGSNTTGTSPAFASPAAPGAPNCSGKASVTDCMATVIANFVPSASGTSGKGYQAASPTNGSDQTHYPQFLCKTGLPYLLITPHC